MSTSTEGILGTRFRSGLPGPPFWGDTPAAASGPSLDNYAAQTLLGWLSQSLTRKSVCLRVTVGAEYPQVFQPVVEVIPIDVVHLQSEGGTPPLGNTTYAAFLREDTCMPESFF